MSSVTSFSQEYLPVSLIREELLREDYLLNRINSEGYSAWSSMAVTFRPLGLAERTAAGIASFDTPVPPTPLELFLDDRPL